MTFNQEYRTAFEGVIALLKVQQERELSRQEHQQLNNQIALCRRYEMGDA